MEPWYPLCSCNIVSPFSIVPHLVIHVHHISKWENSVRPSIIGLWLHYQATHTKKRQKMPVHCALSLQLWKIEPPQCRIQCDMENAEPPTQKKKKTKIFDETTTLLHCTVAGSLPPNVNLIFFFSHFLFRPSSGTRLELLDCPQSGADPEKSNPSWLLARARREWR